jgi:hypothetical protein
MYRKGRTPRPRKMMPAPQSTVPVVVEKYLAPSPGYPIDPEDQPSLSSIENRLLLVLDRQSLDLVRKIGHGALEAADLTMLIQSLKLIRSLKNSEHEAAEELSTADLLKISKGEK